MLDCVLIRPCARSRPRRHAQRAFALIAVLWMVAFLSIMAAGISQAIRQQVRSLGMSQDRIQAQASGDAAIQIALQALVASRQPLARTVTTDIAWQGVPIQVELMPLNGLVNLNTASPVLLARLFAMAGGLAPDAAQQLAQAVVQTRQQRGAGGAPQRFESEEDLLRLPGVDYDLYARLAPLLTAEPRGSGRVNPMAAPLAVLAVLAGGNQAAARQLEAARDAGQVGVDTTALDASLLESTPSRRLRASARVPLADGAAVLVARSVDLDGRSSDGAPWLTFRLVTTVEPAAAKQAS